MKTALITGASQGIGAAIANELNNKKIKGSKGFGVFRL